MTTTKRQFSPVERAYMFGAREGFGLALNQLYEDLEGVKKDHPSLAPLCEKLVDNMVAKQEEGSAWEKLLAKRVLEHGPLKNE